MFRFAVTSPIRIPEPAAISAQLRLFLRASEKQASIGESARLGCVGPVPHPTQAQQSARIPTSFIILQSEIVVTSTTEHLIPWSHILQSHSIGELQKPSPSFAGDPVLVRIGESIRPARKERGVVVRSAGL